MNENGTLDFNDFLDAYGKYGRLKGNSSAQGIFDFLADLTNIQKMILSSDAGHPALGAVIVDLEGNFGQQAEFDLANDFNKQAVGTMVKVILQPFGYEPVKPRLIRAGLSKYFRSASVYRRLNTKPPLRLVQVLVVEKNE